MCCILFIISWFQDQSPQQLREHHQHCWNMVAFTTFNEDDCFFEHVKMPQNDVVRLGLGTETRYQYGTGTYVTGMY